ELNAASVAFYYSGGASVVDEEQMDAEVLPADLLAEQTSWLRIDFDPGAAKDCLHYHSHLHTNMGADVRIPVKRVPTPKQFVEFVVASFYPEIYRVLRLPNGEFQLAESETRELFTEIMNVRADIPNL